MSKITPFLWFDSEAEQAAKFYVSIFPNSKIKGSEEYQESAEEASGKPAGSVLTVEFELDGLHFVALNGGPHFKFTEAVSFQIDCKDQEEVDQYWEKLTADGGSEGQCGWLKDKFGLSWQVVPEALPRLLADPDRAKANRAMGCMLKMKKIIVADLEKAAAGE